MLSSKLREIKDQADVWNLSVVFQALGMTSYSNLTSVFEGFLQRALQSTFSFFTISLPILNTVIKLGQVASMMIKTLILVDKSLK